MYNISHVWKNCVGEWIVLTTIRVSGLPWRLVPLLSLANSSDKTWEAVCVLFVFVMWRRPSYFWLDVHMQNARCLIRQIWLAWSFRMQRRDGSICENMKLCVYYYIEAPCISIYICTCAFAFIYVFQTKLLSNRKDILNIVLCQSQRQHLIVYCLTEGH